MAPFQKRPVKAWSAVALVLFAMPHDFTSLKTLLYLALVNSGGGPGRNWLALNKANGVTLDHSVNCGAGKFGGVD
jgi:hypothetical protein